MSQTQDEALEWLRRDVQKGIDSLEAGHYSDGPTVITRMRQKLLDLKAQPEKNASDFNATVAQNNEDIE